MLIIGITGTTGSGKTTLLHAIERRGGLGIDCDALYYNLLQIGVSLRMSLMDAFGEVFLPDGSLDRKKLGEIIFSSEEKLKTLNAIVYPEVTRAVLQKIAAAKQQGVRLIGIDAINLLQSGIGRLCDLTVAVVAEESRRLARIMERDGISEDYAKARIRAQERDGFFAEHCTKTIENTFDTEEEFASYCDDFLETIIKEYEK